MSLETVWRLAPVITVIIAWTMSCCLLEIKAQLLWMQLHNGTADDVKDDFKNVPRGRRDAALGYDITRNQLVLFGGCPGALNDTWLYNVTINEWREVNTTLRPPARCAAVSGVSGDYFYIATGRNFDTGTYYNDIWRFDFRSETWEMLPSSPKPSYRMSQNTRKENVNGSSFVPSARHFAAGGIYVTGTRFYVSLGTGRRIQDDTYAYDVTTNTWYRESSGCGLYDPSCPHPRYLHSGLVTDRDELIIFSGCLSGEGAAGPCPSHDTWRYDGRSRVWVQLGSCPSPRVYSAMAMLPEVDGKRRAVLYGGQAELQNVFLTTPISKHEVAILDVDTGTWSVRLTRAMPNTSYFPVQRMSAVMASGPNGIFMFGGASLHGVHANDLWVLLGNATDADLSVELPCGGPTVTLVTVHGILMTTGWGVLLPLGALIVRHFRSDHSTAWFYFHVFVQALGLSSALAGFALGVVSVKSGHFCFAHAIVGIVAMGLGVLQTLNALLRPAEPLPEEQKIMARRLWESFHHLCGSAAICLGLANESLGVFLAVASLPIIIAWHTWLGLLCVLFLGAEVTRCVVTMRRKSRSPRRLSLQPNTQDCEMTEDVINGWEKLGEFGLINTSTESVHL